MRSTYPECYDDIRLLLHAICVWLSLIIDQFWGRLIERISFQNLQRMPHNTWEAASYNLNIGAEVTSATCSYQASCLCTLTDLTWEYVHSMRDEDDDRYNKSSATARLTAACLSVCASSWAYGQPGRGLSQVLEMLQLLFHDDYLTMMIRSTAVHTGKKPFL